MKRLLIATFLVVSIAAAPAAAEDEPVLGACEGCDAVFQGLPEKLDWSAILATREYGEPMRIDGVVRDGEGNPVPGIIVYAYQTDKTGVYVRDESLKMPARRHGKLRGWAKTDADGKYRFHTVRPGGYPGTSIAAHVHMHVIEPGRCTYYIDDILFTDDPDLSSDDMGPGRGGKGVATPTKVDGEWRVVRDIVLGANVARYDTCGK